MSAVAIIITKPANEALWLLDFIFCFAEQTTNSVSQQEEILKQPKRTIYRVVYDLINPISTVFQGIDGETVKDFCWIHGSAYIPP